MTSDREKRENSVITSELDEQEQDGLEIPPHQEAVSVKDQDPLPSSLLRYFEASRSRAAACEKLLLEDLDDENMENQNGFLSESSKNEKKQEKRYDEDMEICDLWQQREEDFQRELRKIIEAEKVHQMELELSLKRAHDVFEEELHLQQVTIVALEKLPSCSLSSLVQCSQLRSLTLRRCGLKSLEGIKQLQELSYVDLRENDISYVDCANMTSLRVLRLSHNKLTSIHGLNGAENLDVLELSYNSITRVAGLESLRRLQRLLLDHNHLINTRGLKDVCTLLHLNCASNHLEAVEGLESSTLLHSLDLRANNLTDPPSLNNQVLLRELHLDDNCICSLQGLADCWLPLLQNLSASQNRMTQLPSMMDFISLEHLDLRFNCLSEVLDVCENLQGCPSLCEVWLSGNPLLQERGWRCVLQKAVPGLKAIDGQLTDSSMSASPAPRVISAPGSFLSICREQLQQTQDLQQLHSTELSDASPHLDAVSSLCQHHTLALKLAEEQRLFHENAGATPSSEKPNPKPAPCGKTLYTDSTTAERCYTEEEPSHETIAPNREVIEEDAHEVRRRRTSKGFTCGISFPLEKVPTHHNSDFKRLAAVVIQQRWRKYRQRLKNTTSTVKRTEDNEEELEHVPNNKNTVAATVIQAFWRGFTLRRKLASALAAVECPDGEDDTFEEEEEEFVFDEPNLDKNWTDFEDSSPRYCPVPELKLPPFGPSSYISSHTWSPFQAWTAGEHGDSASQKDSPETSNRSKSPPSTFAASGVSERSERILEEWGFTDRKTALLMLKRAQRMKSTTEERRQKISTAKLGLQQLERTEPRGHMQSQSGRFLPEMNSSILSGGRVQLTAEQAYAEPRDAGALWASSSSSELHSKGNTHPHKSLWDHSSKDVSSAERAASAPSKKERISFRDSPVHQSGGWGGGKKRGRLHK
ncbi:leucine-rich repeat- and IQ domain-containing protein 1 isoform X10 [Oryzias latipes]